MSAALLEAADAGRIVLTPTIELQSTLFAAAERAQQSAGREVWPTPRILDFGSWLKQLHLDRQLLDGALPRCLGEVEERELWRRVVLEHDDGFLEPAGAARAAQRARQAMFEYGMPLLALAAIDSEESRALSGWARRFGEHCRDLGCIPAGELLEQLATLEPPAALTGRLTWIESPLWRPVARNWLQRHAGPALPAVQRDGVGEAPRLVATDSPAAELGLLARWARSSIEANPDFRAWVSIRDLPGRRAQIVDALDAELAPQRFALADRSEGALYAVAGGIPLSRYAPVRAALDLLQAASGSIRFEHFSRLLRSPQLCASSAEASAAARLDAALRSRVPSEATLAQWFGHAQRVADAHGIEPPGSLQGLQSAAHQLDALHGAHPISRWLPLWIKALELGPWAQRQRWSSLEFQSAERFRELLAALALGDRLIGAQTRHAAEQLLQRAARDTAFQVQTGIPPIWISGQSIDPWLAYDGLWVTGVDAASWPPPVDPLPLLPVTLQRRYGVPSAQAETQLALAADLQSRWHARALDCVFSCADGEGVGVQPSPLLGRIGARLAPGLDTGARLPTHWQVQHAARPVLEEIIDEAAPPFDASERTRGVATLRAQSRCAFRGFAETRLEADRLEQPLPGFGEGERGELVHEALQAVFAQIGGSASLARWLDDATGLERLLSDSVARALAKICRRRDPGAHWQQRESARLLALLPKWLELERSRAPFEVEAVETEASTARHGGLVFHVRVDRVDRLIDGAGRIVIDYKSGTAFADWRGERPDNPQLPVYGLLHRRDLVAVAYGRVNAAACKFVAESALAGIFPSRKPTQLEGFASFDALLDAWAVRLDRIASEFAAGSARVAPTPTACRSCRLQGLCRVPSALDREMALESGGETV